MLSYLFKRRPSASQGNAFEVVGARSFLFPFRNSGKVKPGIWNGSCYESSLKAEGDSLVPTKLAPDGYAIVRVKNFGRCEVAGGAKDLGQGYFLLPKIPGARFAFATEFGGGQDDVQIGYVVEWTTRGPASFALELNEALHVIDGRPVLTVA